MNYLVYIRSDKGKSQTKFSRLPTLTPQVLQSLGLSLVIYIMANELTRDMMELFKWNSFSPIRNNGKHEIWSDGISRLPLYRGNASPPRGYQNSRNEIKKACRKAGREFIGSLEEYKRKMKKEKVPVIELEEIEQTAPKVSLNIIQTAMPQELKEEKIIKLLDSPALALCKAWFGMNITQSEMAKKLTEKGYTSPNGFPLSQNHISQFLVKNGYRRLRHTHAKYDANGTLINEEEVETLAEPKPVKEPSPETPITNDLKAFLECNLSPEIKERLLSRLIIS